MGIDFQDCIEIVPSKIPRHYSLRYPRTTYLQWALKCLQRGSLCQKTLSMIWIISSSPNFPPQPVKRVSMQSTNSKTFSCTVTLEIFPKVMHVGYKSFS